MAAAGKKCQPILIQNAGQYLPLDVFSKLSFQMEQPTKSFDWGGWEKGRFPTLESHSAAKLDVLRDYVEDF
jgi:hypothetical protein